MNRIFHKFVILVIFADFIVCVLSMFAYSGVQHILYCVFVLFLFLLPVSLNFPFLFAPFGIP